MLNVVLVSMPYGVLTVPSLAIAQLQGVVRKTMSNEVTIDAAYCYLDFAEFVGLELYDGIGKYENKGLLDWMFRPIAFDVPDNIDSYREFFFSDCKFPKKTKIFDQVVEKRREIGAFLDGLIERYDLCRYPLVGFTSLLSQGIASFALAQRLKQRNPDVITCLGGPNAEHPMGKAIAAHIPQIDYVFSGEGLVSFPAFLNAAIAGDQVRMASVKGVHTRASAETDAVSNGALVCGKHELEANSGDIFDINDLPLLDYSGYLDRVEQSPLRDRLKPGLVLTFQTSSGCWWADKVPCSFCSFTPQGFRKMEPDTASNYIGALIDKYKDDFWLFAATDPSMPNEYPREVLSYVNQDKRVPLQYEVRVTLREEDMINLAQANVVLPQPGIESLSTKTLKIIRKGITAVDCIQFLKRCTELGMYPIWNYLYGFPNANYDELESGKLIDDIQTLYHLPPPAGISPIYFQRYAEYRKEQDRYGLQLRPLEHYKYSFPFSEEVISELAYTFYDSSYDKRMFERSGKGIHAIVIELARWMDRFREKIPRLYFVNENLIYDTRSGKPVQHKISKIEREMLLFLNKPRKMNDIEKALHLSRDEVEAMTNRFIAYRFLFCDRDKYLSVVCRKCSLNNAQYSDYHVRYSNMITSTFD